MPVVEVDSELRDILPGFLENRKKDISDLKNALAKNDFKTIEKIGHRVAGSSGGYGFYELGKIAKEMELNCKAGKTNDIEKLLKDFEENIINAVIKFV